MAEHSRIKNSPSAKFIRWGQHVIFSIPAMALLFTATIASPAFSLTAPPADTSTNPGYRVQIYVNSNSGYVNLPPSTQSWIVEYKYLVPPLPTSSTWDYTSQTVYQWGDQDFDIYGANGNYKLSNYVFNQIVPTLFIGHVLSANDAYYNPSWNNLSSWAIQSQYYWQQGTTPYAQTGPIVYVNPGDQITTDLNYDSVSGTIVATISDDNIPGPSGQSSITILKPFPDEPSLFSSWSDFFNKAEAMSNDQFIIGHPVLNVETGYVDQPTVCGLLPFTVNEISTPGFTSMPSEFTIEPVGGLTCSQPLATLNF